MQKKKKIFKILKRKADCVLLMKEFPSYEAHRIMYHVRDIENDIVYMGYDYDSAENFFTSFDINKIREEKKKLLEDWLFEFAENKSAD